ncbi:MAG: hypothetical protein WDZ69_01535 [Candidatus Pacearchaeota archaeon]
MNLKNKMVSTATGIGLLAMSACASVQDRSDNESIGHTIEGGCVPGAIVRISYDDEMSWRTIVVKSNYDEHYVSAKDYPANKNGKFDEVTTSDFEMNHPLEKYNNSPTLEDIYNKIKSGDESVKCS